MHTLIPMGQVELAEDFRCRIYDGGDRSEEARVTFVEQLAGEGAIDCPVYDGWVAALQARGWLPQVPELEPNPAGPGKVGRWRLTDVGRAEWRALRSV